MTTAVLTIGLTLAHGAAITVLLLHQRRQPAATLAWLLTLVLLPGVGLVAYRLIGQTRYQRTIKRSKLAGERIDAVRRRFDVERKLDRATAAVPEPRTVGLLRLGAAVSSTRSSPGNRVRLLIDGAATYRAMLLAIEAAEHHVNIEFYIVQPDETGRRLRERLVRTAERGVQVRVLVDGIGSSRLPRDFWKPLEAAGGKAAVFRPVPPLWYRPLRRDRVDFRDHRKIIVVDGRVGFTGGINIGREYLGLDPDMGAWRDTHIELRGPAVLSLQSAFAENWFYSTGEELDDERQFPEPEWTPDGAVVQVVDSGPDTNWNPIEAMYAHAISGAEHRVWITNPYFIPSPTIENVLIAASLRGVDVRLLVPLRSDSRLVQIASRSYFPRLIEAGVRVFRFSPGFVHAKTMVVDEWVGTVGSANMDMRSFQLNFELNPFIVGAALANSLAEEFLDDLRRSEEVTLADLAKVTVFGRLASNLARLASPLL